MKRIIYAFLLIFFAAVISSCAPLTPVATVPPTQADCQPEEVNAFIEAARDADAAFQALAAKTEDASADELETLIKEMQLVEEEFKAIDAPPCALKAKAALENYFSSAVQCAFAQFAEAIGAPESDTDFCALAEEQYGYYQESMEELAP